MSFDFEAVESLKDVQKTDHVVVIVDDVVRLSGEEGEPASKASIGGHVAFVEYNSLKSNATTHELGHNIGLDHVANSSSLMYKKSGGKSGVSMGEKGLIAGGHILQDGTKT